MIKLDIFFYTSLINQLFSYTFTGWHINPGTCMILSQPIGPSILILSAVNGIAMSGIAPEFQAGFLALLGCPR